MRELGRDDDLALRQRAPVIEGDKFGDKVRQPADGPYLKLFRRKRRVTSAALKRYARRFVDNPRHSPAWAFPARTSSAQFYSGRRTIMTNRAPPGLSHDRPQFP